MKFNLKNFINSFAIAVDMAELDYFKINLNHGRRVAYLCMIIANEFELNNKDKQDLFCLSLLHDNGVVLSGIEHKNYNQFELTPEHCTTGENNLKNLPLRKKRKNVIKYHHEEYDGSGTFGLYDKDIPLFSKIIHIADTIDTSFCLNSFNNLYYKNKIINFIKTNIKKRFNPEIADAAILCFKKEKTFFDLQSDNMEEILSKTAPDINYNLNWEQINKICDIYISLIDSKSKFTFNHSKGIVKKTKKMSEYYGFDNKKHHQLNIAATLHDLGKLYVPNRILDKPAKLKKNEFIIIKKHPYYTKNCLEKIPEFKKIAQWAGNHHEKIDGSGYPQKLKDSKLDFESRLLCVIDIFQAITEHRAYRKSFNNKRAFKFLNSLSKTGQIDKKIVSDIKQVF